MEENSPPAPGETVKVWLPGETPWAECQVVHPDGSWQGRIDNHLVYSKRHGLSLNDIVRFVPFDDAPRCPWQVAHLAQ